MHFTSALIALLSSIHVGHAGYVLQDEYNPSNFFDMFNFYSGPDPTEGFVKMLDRPSAQQAGLIMNNNSGAYLGVDTTNITPQGRPSLRLESKKSYTGGLIIADIAHMPGSICGAWPAFWTIGPNWPSNGEIDIIEGVNSEKVNAMTLHTNPGCSITRTANMAGNIRTTNCDIHAPDQATNQGCAVGATGQNTYGDGFNAIGGGVYATHWTSDSIAVYYFPRYAIPADISSGYPEPSSWGVPQAKFEGACDFTQAIQQQTIVFDTTFCGQWAGDPDVWGSDPVCSQKAASCNDYVANNPAAFEEAYWLVNYVKVFQSAGSGIPTAVPRSVSGTGFPGANPTSNPNSGNGGNSNPIPIPTGVPTSSPNNGGSNNGGFPTTPQPAQGSRLPAPMSAGADGFIASSRVPRKRTRTRPVNRVAAPTSAEGAGFVEHEAREVEVEVTVTVTQTVPEVTTSATPKSHSHGRRHRGLGVQRRHARQLGPVE